MAMYGENVPSRSACETPLIFCVKGQRSCACAMLSAGRIAMLVMSGCRTDSHCDIIINDCFKIMLSQQ